MLLLALRWLSHCPKNSITLSGPSDAIFQPPCHNDIVRPWSPIQYQEKVSILLGVQGNAIQERMDPFFTLRDAKALGYWTTTQPAQCWPQLRKIRLQGPRLIASWRKKFCGENELYLSRRPPESEYGQMSWTAVMAAFKPYPTNHDACS